MVYDSPETFITALFQFLYKILMNVKTERFAIGHPFSYFRMIPSFPDNTALFFRKIDIVQKIKIFRFKITSTPFKQI